MHKMLSLLLWLSLATVGLSAQTAKNMSLAGQLGYGNNDLSDVWGYVDSAGTEYALVGTFSGFSIVSLANPAQPVQVQFIPGAGTIWRDIKTWGHYAYVSNEGGNGLLVVDLSGLPGSVAYKDTIIGGINTIHNLWVDEAGFLYTAGGNTLNGGVAVLDLNENPWLPKLADGYDLTYVHDLYVRNGLGYTAEIYEGRLAIVDFRAPAGPEVLGSTTYIDGFTHNTWLNDAGDVCFTTDELSAAYIYAWDVSDPEDIRMLDRIRSPLSGGVTIPHNVHVKDDFLVISYYRDGIYVVDAARPHNLIEVGYYDTSPLSGSGFNGSWGAYPFLPSGLVLASDMEEGLFVLQPSYPRACYLEGTVRDSVTLAPLGQVTLTVAGGAMDGQSATDGSFATGTVDAGTYTVTFSRFGYVPKTLTVNLQNGLLTQLDVLLEPTARAALDLTVRDARSLDPLPQVQVEAIPVGTTFTFDYATDLDGRVQQPDFVAGSYRFILGQWGHRTLDTFLTVQPGTGPLEILLDPGYYDDFVMDFGWSVSGDAGRGVWERGAPVLTTLGGTPINPGQDLSGDIGDQAYVTGNGGGNPGDDDVDNGTTILQSPVMDLSGYREPLLRLHWWLVNLNTNTNRQGDDFLRIELSNALGNIPLITFTDSLANQWNLLDSLPIGNFFAPGTPVTIRFVTRDAGQPNLVEAAIDGFEVIEGDPLPDTVATALDLLAPDRLRYYPQPAQEQVFLAYDLDAPAQLDLYDLRGRHLSRQVLTPGQATVAITLPGPAGTYLAVLRQGERVLHRRKLLKQ